MLRRAFFVTVRASTALLLVLATSSLATAQRRSQPPVRPPVPRPQATTKPTTKADTTAKPAAPQFPSNYYWVYVGAESQDVIQRLRLGPDGFVVEKTIPVGFHPTEMEGPHGLQVSRDGKYLHMTTGHGQPDGMYWKFELGPDTLVGPPIFLGNFPASIDVTPDGLYAFSVNFNLHGEMVPSSVSVVYTPTNTEIARTTTCTMPHGSRIDPTGQWQYSACMMDDQLVEIDTRTYQVNRRFSVAKGKEGNLPNVTPDEHAKHDANGAPMKMTPSCSPTWAQPSADGSKVYVACNKADEIVEVDRAQWSVSRRFKTGRGVYNMAVTPDGRLLVASLKQGGAVQVFDLTSGQPVMEMKSTTTVTHGITISPDSRYAFVSNESVGALPGKVDVYDLKALARLASVETGLQSGGIAFWKTAPNK
jgi:DNA-binding beta-propeller fold protein YncE